MSLLLWTRWSERSWRRPSCFSIDERCSWNFCGEARNPYNCLLSFQRTLLSCSHSGGGLTSIVVSDCTGVLRNAD
eukprot:4394150-Amphidinium_carterae.1